MSLLTLKLSLIKAYDQLNDSDISFEDYVFIRNKIVSLESQIKLIEG